MQHVIRLLMQQLLTILPAYLLSRTFHRPVNPLYQLMHLSFSIPGRYLSQFSNQVMSHTIPRPSEAIPTLDSAIFRFLLRPCQSFTIICSDSSTYHLSLNSRLIYVFSGTRVLTHLISALTLPHPPKQLLCLLWPFWKPDLDLLWSSGQPFGQPLWIDAALLNKLVLCTLLSSDA